MNQVKIPKIQDKSSNQSSDSTEIWSLLLQPDPKYNKVTEKLKLGLDQFLNSDYLLIQNKQLYLLSQTLLALFRNTNRIFSVCEPLRFWTMKANIAGSNAKK